MKLILIHKVRLGVFEIFVWLALSTALKFYLEDEVQNPKFKGEHGYPTLT